MTKHVSILIRITSLLAVAFVAIGCLESSVTTTTSAALAVAEEGATDAPADASADEPADAPADEPADAPADAPADEPAGDAGGDGAALVSQICSQCHGLKDAGGAELTVEGTGEVAGGESFAGVWMTATPRDWAATVDRMKGPNKCPMTDEEAAAITEWLNENVS